MSATNTEYDFKWCPGCGDFGVRRALEFAMKDWVAKYEVPMESNVVVAGIGCSGNLVHLIEGAQPYGLHGIHGRTLPLALGVKMGRPELNVVIVAGDGDFLSIGAEHLPPQAARNLNVCAVIMDNGVYGLTKGQSSPTTEIGVVTSSTPFGKMETQMNPLSIYMALGVSFVASGFSSKPRDLAKLITAGMEHQGFAMVHVQSPCTTYNDNYEILKGNVKKGIQPLAYSVPEDHDPSNSQEASALINAPGLPVGLIYEDTSRPSLDQQVQNVQNKMSAKGVEELLDSYQVT